LALLLHNLARSCQKQGKYVEAETLLERVLHMRERTLAADHLDIAYTLYDLADLWETTGKAVETQPLFSRALDIFTHVLGPEHRLTCEARQRLHISHADQI
jgi:tetratricopeptide (TPR) repeat protein